jgi:hypothetical protein
LQAAQTAAAVVSKGEFARLKNVSAGRVSQWIAEGKITGDALAGDGRMAKINVDVATAQLRRHLDVGQRFGNGLGTRLDPPAAVPAATLPPAPTSDPIEDQYKREKLREIGYRNRDAAEKELARRGHYVVASESRASLTAVAAGMMNVIEGGLVDMATAISSQFSLPQRDVLHSLRASFREIRIKAAAAAQRSAEAMPALLVDQVENEGMRAPLAEAADSED